MSENQKPSLPQGILISGICKGVREEVYNNRPSYYVGFDVATKDDYGQTRVTTEEVSVYGDSLQAILDKARAAVGKHCVISVVKRALKSDRTGNAYMRTGIHRNSQIMVIN